LLLRISDSSANFKDGEAMRSGGISSGDQSQSDRSKKRKRKFPLINNWVIGLMATVLLAISAFVIWGSTFAPIHPIYADVCSLVGRGTQTVDGFPVYEKDTSLGAGYRSWGLAAVFTVREHSDKTRVGIQVPAFTALEDASLAQGMKLGNQSNAFQLIGTVQRWRGRCVLFIDEAYSLGQIEGG
jgi:hypothetical protein